MRLFRRASEKPHTQPDVVPEVAATGDPFLAAVAEFRAAAQRTLAVETAQHRADIADASAIIQRAQTWVEESGTGMAACHLYEASVKWSVPYSAKHKPESLGISEVQRQGGGGSVGTTTTTFIHSGNRWTFTHIGPPDHLPDPNIITSKLSIAVNDMEVLSLKVQRDFKQYGRWKVERVSSLIVGEWATELIEMHAVVHRCDTRADTEFTADLMKKAAVRFQL